MEKKIKYMSILSITVLIMFIVSTFLSAGMTANGQEGIFITIMFYTANVLIYAALVMFLVTFIMGVYCIIKRRNTMPCGKPKSDEIIKFPAAWFIISTVLFILVLIFLIAVMSVYMP